MDEHLPNPGDIQEHFNIAIIDVSGARRDNARDMADERLTAEMQAKGGFRGMVQRVWKGNLAHEYYRQKYFHESLGEIDTTGNLYAGRGDVNSEEAMGVVVDRFTSAYGDEVLHHGERRYQLDEHDAKDEPVRTSITNLLGSFARGELDEKNFEEEKNRVLKELVGKNPEMFGDGAAFADNMLEIAQNVKAAIRHGKGLDEILARSKFIVGEARMGVRSEAKFSRVDKTVERIRQTKLGALLNESTISAAAAVAVGVAKWGGQRSVSAALTVTGGIGAGGAVFAAAREGKHFKEERTQHMRESAMGQAFGAEAKRRGKLEQTRYETKSAQELTGELHSIVSPEGAVKSFDTGGDYMDAISRVAAVRARIKMSDKQNIDLIHFSDIKAVEKERLNLDLALATVRKNLRDIHATKGGELLPDEHKSKTFDGLLEEYENTFIATQDEQIAEKDVLFAKMRRTQMAKAAVTGLIVGAAIGTVVQEGMAHLPGIGDNVYGLGEHVSAKNMSSPHHNTLLHGIFQGKESHAFSSNPNQLQQLHLSSKADLSLPEGFTAHQTTGGNWEVIGANGKPYTDILMNKDGTISATSSAHLAQLGFPVHESTITHALSGQTHELSVGNDKFIIPKEFNAKELSSGHWQLIDAKGHVVSQYDLNPDGSLAQASVANLQHAGVNVNIASHTDLITGPSSTVDVDPHTFVANHMNQTTQVHRTLWYGNDTPAPKFDLNELKLHAGGVESSWFDGKGNAVIDVSRMAKDGSFQSGKHANPFELTGNGKLALAVSASKDTQSTTFNFDFVTGPDGRTHAIIPPDSPIHQLFKMENGKRVFSGRYLEVMEMTGNKDQFGEQVKVLSTFVGKSNGPMHDVIPGSTTPVTHHINTFKFPPTSEKIQTLSINGARIAESGGDILPIVPIPLRARRGLEIGATTTPPPERRYNYYNNNGYGAENIEEVDELIDATMPELLEDPGVHVQTSRACNWYKDLLARNRGEGYVDEIESIVTNAPELAALDDATKAIVSIPVAALADSSNIFRTLSLYGQQAPEDVATTPILLHVNWPREAGATSEAQEKISTTLSEIERARTAFPNLKIAVMQSEWSPEEMSTGVIGHVVRKLFDTAILATKRAIDEGRMDADHEVVIIRNDADAKGISPHYIERMVQTVTREGVDAASGRIRWGIDQTKNLPGLALALKIDEGIRGSAERARQKGVDVSVQTAGANTGVRLSVLAAVGSLGFSEYTGAGSDDLAVGRRIKGVRGTGTYVRQRHYQRQHGGRQRGWGGRRSSYSPYLNGNANADSIVMAHGAMIDTDVSRMEGEYRNGRLVSGAWNDDGFNVDGYRPRTAALLNNPQLGESLDDPDTIHNLEYQINGLINDWRISPVHAEMEFRRTFPSNKPDEEPMYTLKTDNKGNMRFEFTPSGIELLRKRSTRNNRGQYDPIGSRRLRVNYGRTAPNSRLRTPRVPRLVEVM